MSVNYRSGSNLKRRASPGNYVVGELNFLGNGKSATYLHGNESNPTEGELLSAQYEFIIQFFSKCLNMHMEKES